MYMRFRGDGVEHQATKTETQHLTKDLDSPLEDDTADLEQREGDGNLSDSDLNITRELNNSIPIIIDTTERTAAENEEQHNSDEEEIDPDNDDYGYDDDGNEGEGQVDDDDPAEDAKGEDDLGPEDGEEVEGFDDEFEGTEGYAPL